MFLHVSFRLFINSDCFPFYKGISERVLHGIDDLTEKIQLPLAAAAGTVTNKPLH